MVSCVGDRELCISSLEVDTRAIFYTDGWQAYEGVIEEKQHRVINKHGSRIEFCQITVNIAIGNVEVYVTGGDDLDIGVATHPAVMARGIRTAADYRKADFGYDWPLWI